MTEFTLSVLMCNYNYGKYVGEAIEAILAQSFQPKEIVIIDDGSADNSVSVIETIARKNPVIKFIRNEQNKGIFYSANLALNHVSSEYLYGASSDDKILPGLFEKSMNLLSQYPQAGLCTSLARIINETGEDLGVLNTPIVSTKECYISPAQAVDLLKKYGSWFSTYTAFYKRSVLLELGGFSPELQAFWDGFICRVIALKCGSCFIPEPLVAWRRSTSGYASKFSHDPNIALEVMQRAGNLMRNKFSDLFPVDYVMSLERKMFFEMLDSWNKNLSKTISDFSSKIPSPTFIDKLFFQVLILIRHCEFLFFKTYLFTRLRFDEQWSLLLKKLKGSKGKKGSFF